MLSQLKSLGYERSDMASVADPGFGSGEKSEVTTHAYSANRPFSDRFVVENAWFQQTFCVREVVGSRRSNLIVSAIVFTELDCMHNVSVRFALSSCAPPPLVKYRMPDEVFETRILQKKRAMHTQTQMDLPTKFHKKRKTNRQKDIESLSGWWCASRLLCNICGLHKRKQNDVFMYTWGILCLCHSHLTSSLTPFSTTSGLHFYTLHSFLMMLMSSEMKRCSPRNAFEFFSGFGWLTASVGESHSSCSWVRANVKVTTNLGCSGKRNWQHFFFKTMHFQLCVWNDGFLGWMELHFPLRVYM